MVGTKELKHYAITPDVGYETMLRQNIEQPVRGVQALAVSLRETINNAIDARAENVRIMLGSFRGKEALITMDDGVGFDRKGLNSVMGYAASSRLRTDKRL